jgi:hypothetical protein
MVKTREPKIEVGSFGLQRERNLGKSYNTLKFLAPDWGQLAGKRGFAG